MIWVFEVVSPGSDLDGEEWEIHDLTRVAAEARADAKLVRTFVLASAERKAATTLRLLGTRRTWGAELVALSDRQRSAA